jgi:signal transduction histidine kinase
VFVWGDASALRQLVLNLLLNAAQALGDGGQITVTRRVAGQQVVISVRDDGEGMTPELLAKVREPFFSTKSGGTGLGLAIAERIARAHGGLLEIESHPGQGTEVRVSVPCPGPRDVSSRSDPSSTGPDPVESLRG